VPDALAACAWIALGMWGLSSVQNAATTLGRDPRRVSGIADGLLVTASGWVLIGISVVMLVAALARLAGDGQPIAPDVASLALGIALIVLFLGFVAWAIPSTDRYGISAVILIEVPYLMAAVGVLFARSRRARGERTRTIWH
jgi:hypothetical protein